MTSSTEPTRYRVEVYLSYEVDEDSPQAAEEHVLSRLEDLDPAYYDIDVECAERPHQVRLLVAEERVRYIQETYGEGL